MSDDDERVPLDACTLPGTITVSRAAMAFAERFQRAVPAGWIVSFSWHDGERRKASKDAPWVDMGPGLGLGAYRIDQIPEEVIYHSGSFRYAVIIPKDVVENHPRKTIDLDDAGGVVLE